MSFSACKSTVLLVVLCGVLLRAFALQHALSYRNGRQQLLPVMYSRCQPSRMNFLPSTALAATDSGYKHRIRCTCLQCRTGGSKDRGSSSSSSSSSSASILRSRRAKSRTAVYMSEEDSDKGSDNKQENEEEGEEREEGEEEGNVQDSEVVSDGAEDGATKSTEPVPLDPLEAAIIVKEAELALKVQDMEIYLRSERLSLSRTKDKVSESGKNGYFIVQAQVAEFLKRKEAEQKERVRDNKREFVMKMVPVVDSFRQAPLTAPAATEREQTMHSTFGSLLKLVLNVFEKYGYKLFDAALGEKYDASRFEVQDLVEVAEGEGEDGVVLSQVNCGMTDNDGVVVRRAKVTVSKVKKAA